MLRFLCPGCKGLLQLPPSMAGSLIRCGKCHQPLKVPGTAPEAISPPSNPTKNPDRKPPPPPTDELVTPAPSRQPPVRKPRQVPPELPPPILSVGERKHSNRRPKQSGFLIVGAVLTGVVLIGGGIGGWMLIGKPIRSFEKQASNNISETKKNKDLNPEKSKKNKEVPKKVTNPPQTAEKGEWDDLLEMINRQRTEAGVSAVKIDTEHSLGCTEHANYLAKNRSRLQQLDIHEQESELPASTKAGKLAAPFTCIVQKQPREAIRDWLSAPGHRAMLLRGELKSIGLGTVRNDKEGHITVIDWLRGAKERTTSDPNEPVVYPAPQQRDIPLYYPGNEIPDPLPNTKEKIAGFPVTATFKSSIRLPDARAQLEDEAGNEVPVWISTPTRPANEKFARLQQNTICLFSRRQLKPGTRYIVRMEASPSIGGDSKEWSKTWSFTTQGPAFLGRIIYDRALHRLNTFRKMANLDPVSFDSEKSQACALHAAYLARNLGSEIEINDEKEDLPGFTKEGQAIAKRAAIRLGGGMSPRDGIDWLFSSVLNRHLMLNPTMKSVAMGTALQAPKGWIWVITVPTGRVEGDGPNPILFPGKNQTDVPQYFGREVNSMVSDVPEDAVAGFAITANFFPRDSVLNVKGQLKDEMGNEVSCWISTPEKPLKNIGRYRQIILVPKKSLNENSRYTVDMKAEVNGKEWSETWNFTTINATTYRSKINHALIKQVNEIRKVAGLNPVVDDAAIAKGCQLHAEYVVKNLNHPRVQGLGIHDEDPSLPGASKDGARAGKLGVIALISDPIDSVDGWMSTLYHRLPILDPRLKRIGYGQAKHPTQGWITVMDVGSGRE